MSESSGPGCLRASLGYKEKNRRLQAGPGVKLYLCAPGLAYLYKAPTVCTAYAASSQEASRANWILNSCCIRSKSVPNSQTHRKRLDALGSGTQAHALKGKGVNRRALNDSCECGTWKESK